jgi:hypothetical protein
LVVGQTMLPSPPRRKLPIQKIQHGGLDQADVTDCRLRFVDRVAAGCASRSIAYATDDAARVLRNARMRSAPIWTDELSDLHFLRVDEVS